ncbi:uncharacterized protein LOC141641444 [Silene latifolia]|uniref:uncharacterized protein LOC141641444 n=1 Tax=Silene latifolia TaxID=37657 RepID=UPI003D771A70
MGVLQKPRVYNKPTTSEITALIMGDSNNNSAGRDIIIEHRSDGLQRINELHPSYMALQYPLLFPCGEDSYYIGIKYYYDLTSSNKKKRKRECVTMREYYAYRLQQRLSDGYALLRGGKLLQQFIVDCCCVIESERLWYIRRNQSTIRCDMLNNICDAVTKGDYIGAKVGMRIFLPSSFTGGPRYMQANYQDAMAICRFYGNPHLFITFIANPKWSELDIMLRHIPGQRPEDRPDIMTRVFKLKLEQLMDCLKKDRYFGDVVANIYTIEFQKRGLPHAHILLWLKKDGSQVSPEYIDSIIKAEIPDKDEEPELYNIVSQFMVHGPCGDDNPSCSCMINNTCSKKYPKKSCEQTTIDHNGYPVYRRREDDRYIKKGVQCNTARAIKYLFKYILKGPDKATVLLKSEKEDEIKAYLDCRYLSECEASWKIFEFDFHQRNPSVIRLPVHLPGEQFLVLSDTSNLQGVINRANSCHTKLTGWFAANKTYPEARKLTYAQFPSEYVWKNGWIKRSKGKSVGRIAYVHPTTGERYYLRLLLNIVKGPTSFEELRTIDKRLFSSYKAACFAYGLLSDDKEWHEAMSEANRWAMPYQLREMFVTILLFCEVTDIKTFWENSYSMLSEDIERRKRKAFNHPTLILQEDVKRSYTLIEIDKMLMRYGKTLKDIRDMPLPGFEELQGMDNKLIREERLYDQRQLNQEWSENMKQLNTDQLLVYNDVMDAVSNGIAALLLPGGRIAHSRFDIPIDLFENSTCNISQKSQLAELIRMASLIIWDEAPMDNRFAFEALDRTLRDVMAFQDPQAEWRIFGGKVVLLGGDFRQVVFDKKLFNEWLLAMGGGHLEASAEDNEEEATWIKIPEQFIGSVRELDLTKVVAEMYPDFDLKHNDENYLRERAILTPLNETTDLINNYMAGLLPGGEVTYRSCDEICSSSTECEDHFTSYPTEYLNSLVLQGVPRHELKLKVGMPVMLLRNISHVRGLCNGTRLIITRLGKFIVEGKIITGSKIGKGNDSKNSDDFIGYKDPFRLKKKTISIKTVLRHDHQQESRTVTRPCRSLSAEAGFQSRAALRGGVKNKVARGIKVLY